MHETLKELAGELAVIHEALERAEVIERQLPAYLRELEAERDELRAELIKVLRFVGGQATEDVSTSFLLNVSEEVSALLAGMAGATADLRAEVERLREKVEFWEAAAKLADKTRDDLHEAWSELNNSHVIKLREVIDAANTAERERDEAQSHAADLRGALEGLRRYLPTYCKKADCRANRCVDARVAHSSLEAVLASTPPESLARLKAEALRSVADQYIKPFLGFNNGWYSDGIRDAYNAVKDAAERMEKEDANGR